MKILMKMVGVAGLLAGTLMVSGCGSDGSGFFFLPQLPDLAITKSHVGNFRQNQQGVVYTLNVSNAGVAPTDGTVTVTDTLPAGITAAAISGTGWTCTLANLTCTRTDALAAGASYPAITLTANVAPTATTPQTNTATVSGGGDANPANNTASDAAVIDSMTISVAAPNLAPFNASVTTFRFEVHPWPVSSGTPQPYQVSFFAPLDVIQFDAGSAVDVVNTSGTDGVIDVRGTLGGNIGTVHLTGVPAAEDGQVFSVNSFRAVYGQGSLLF